MSAAIHRHSPIFCSGTHTSGVLTMNLRPKHTRGVRTLATS